MGNCCTPAETDFMATDTGFRIEKLNPKKVAFIWSRKRGETDPATSRVNSIIAASDENNDGVLSFDESVRMCRKFLERSDLDHDSEDIDSDTLQAIFHSIDTNGDKMLDREEVEMALKAMWLMTRDGISLDELTGDGDPEPIFDTAPVPTQTSRAGTGTVKKKKLSQSKVESVWRQKRGENAEGPDDAAVERVMQKSKRAISRTGSSSDGALTKTEAQRISKAFLKKASMENGNVDLVFDYLDGNDDGVLDKTEIALAMKAMWLMSTDGVKLDQLLEDCA